MFTFNEDNFLHMILCRIWDIVLVNMLFIACSIPIVTIGPAFTAMHHTTLRIMKENNPGTFRTFFHAFKQNFKQSFIVWITSLICIIILLANMEFLKTMNTSFAGFLYYASYIILIFIFVMNLYIHPVIAVFEGTIKTQINNSVIFIFTKPAYAFIMFILWAFPLALTYLDTGLQSFYTFCWVFFGFGTIAYINSTFLYRLFKPYLPEDNDNDITPDLEFRTPAGGISDTRTFYNKNRADKL